jgi:uncharacterized repeat protein (TIGR03847 family)
VAFQQHDFELLSVLDAEAIGEPGQRRFRLMAGVPGDIVSLWMEKEQLNALGTAIEQLVEQLREAGLVQGTLEPDPAPAPGPVPFGEPEYLVSKMAIGFDEERKLVAIFAHDVEQEDDTDPIFSGRATLANASALAERITAVVAAGRPRCPRCGAPIGPEGHVCPHDNGHLPWPHD